MSDQLLHEIPHSMLSSAVSSEESHWYAVHTRARHEKKVAVQLEEKGITAFVPTITEVRRWTDRQVRIQLPLFSCYAFVHIVPSNRNRLNVLNVRGLLGFVGTRGVGITIPDKEIDDIRALLASDAACAPCPFLKVGTRVRIRGGALDGVEGVLVTKNADQSLVVSIELIQRSMSVRLHGYDLEPIPAVRPPHSPAQGRCHENPVVLV
jgi:transcription antitermination factor NusG